jgi:hypothetical protein
VPRPTLVDMEVLLWLAPTAVVTIAAMLWVAWAGREGRGEVDREVALRRMARVLDPPQRRGVERLRRRRPAPTYVVRPERERSTGIAVRPSRPTRPSSTEEHRRAS